MRTALQNVHKSADMHRGIQRSGFTDVGKHGGDGGFPVAARYTYNILVAFRQLAQRNGALELRDTALRCGHAFYVCGLDGSRIDHQVCVAKVFCAMADCNGHAELF